MNKKDQGWLNLYKPKNISSFLALKKIKNKFNIPKIGHAGTLDPLAEGVLPIALGKTTKLIPFVNFNLKNYIFTIKWGEQTSTDDTEGNIINKSSKVPNDIEIKQSFKNFLGFIEQVPPNASAVKFNGERAYKLLRSKKKFDLKSKKVFLKSIKILKKSSESHTTFKIECGKGFYVRSLARDLAKSLGTFGHITYLNRTKVGFFSNKTAILLDELLKIGQTDFEFNCIHSSMSMLDDILAYEIEEKKDFEDLAFGKSIRIDKKKLIKPPLNLDKKNTVFLSKKGNIISFGKLNGDLFKPNKILI